MNLKTLLFTGGLLLPLLTPSARALVLVDSSTPGFYNESLGTVLDGTSYCFPTNTDPGYFFPVAPDLSAAAGLLGGWLLSPPVLDNGFWSPAPQPIPTLWPVWTETAVVYAFEVEEPGAVNLVARFGVDNGVFCWLDGVYMGGAMDQGGAAPWEYNFPVPDLAPGIHHLQVLREDHGGGTGYYVLLEGVPGDVHTAGAQEAPAAYSLKPAFPNPFNPTTTLEYSLAKTGAARLSVHDLSGREVALLVDGLQEAGAHPVVFDAAALPSGVYFARLQAEGRVETQKLLLVK